MSARLIREAIQYEGRNNLKGEAAAALLDFAGTATDAELIRFRDLITQTASADLGALFAQMDSADLSRANVD